MNTHTRAIASLAAICLATTVATPRGQTARNLERMIDEKVEVWVELNVSFVREHTFEAGIPSRPERADMEIGFRRAGVWTLARMKDGMLGGYRAFPGRLTRTEFPAVSNVGVTARHPCQDGEGGVMGRQTVHQHARVHPALGGIELRAAPGGRVRILLAPSQIEVAPVECPRVGCNAGFPSGGIEIGENRKDLENDDEDEDEGEDVVGYELGLLQWESIKAVGRGGDIELALPLGADGVWEADRETLGAFDIRIRETYRVRGTITPVPVKRQDAP